MPLFRFHLRSLAGLESDDEGLQFPDLETAYLEACRAIPGMAIDFVRSGLNPMSYAFEITDAAGRRLIEVPFSERLRDGRRPRRPKRPRRPAPRTPPHERRSMAETVYHLRCSYRFADTRQGMAVDTRSVKARNADTAIAAAQKVCLDPPDMQLVSAFLISLEGTIVWSKHVPCEPAHWAEATRGVPRFAQV
ncbi:hypothetical protein MKK84_16510 [Methylobacterium sp. E-065]|uniref:DUF6894 family protein n=1 Tax=Methylobacterium sp. E-065 TaxID=2836583 RepID=UPI001FBBA487|nr:hypothetical protein [Methylobacterium sp. E-065]MCJ2019026.1 hypothetical protein [Methylobacterium sp. E-065]